MAKKYIKGLPLPEGCEDMGIIGIRVNKSTGEMDYTFDGDVPKDIQEKLKHQAPGAIIEDIERN